MLLKTITKFFVFVISLTVFSGCYATFLSNKKHLDANAQNSADYLPPNVVGTLQSKDITESSGIAASQCQPNVFWTHNDSGDDAFIFAVNGTGENLGTYKVSGAKNVDWEDIDESKTPDGKCVLYIGDIGNNLRNREEMTIYIVGEPQISDFAKSSNRKNPLETEPAQTSKFVYPDEHHDAETLMVNPANGDIYVLSKQISGASGVYKLKHDFDAAKTNKLEKIADFKVPAVPNGFLTGGSIAPDGKRAVICDYVNAYEITLPADAKTFDEIWRQTPKVIELGNREQGEAIGYSADGNSIYATSEGKKSPLIKVERK